jgi:Cu(I)/Ag(I) efflux system membrane fusion protein
MKTTILKVGFIAMLMAGMFIMPTKASANNMNNIELRQGKKMVHAMFPVKGLCDQCKSRIENAAKGVKGVESAMWDQKTKVLHLQYDPTLTSPLKVQQAIAKVGHDAGNVKATAAAYKSLPKCCQYPRK